MAKIPVQSVSGVKQKKLDPEQDSNELCASLCYHYPGAYTLSQARRLPYKDLVLLLKQAQREQAAFYYTLTQIVTAPHTVKGKGVKKLSEQFRKAMK